MRVETRRKLIFTKEEQRVIAELQKIFDEDSKISIDGVWDVLTDIANGYNELAVDYGYDIEIED